MRTRKELYKSKMEIDNFLLITHAELLNSPQKGVRDKDINIYRTFHNLRFSIQKDFGLKKKIGFEESLIILSGLYTK